MPEFVVAHRLFGDRYRLDRFLGGGGMATVWGGRDLRLDRPIAIKELSGEGLRQPMALERFDREARAVGRLSHPNVVSVYDVGTQDGLPFLVLELVEGPTVATLLANGPLPVADVLAMGSQVCDGLAAAHAAGIIHRDIKPANLIVTPSGVVKICDFGVARLLDSSGNTNLTGPATAWGSPNYMAPEQINGGLIDLRTDLYALGCTLYAMLTGAPPFTGDGTFAVLQQHVTRPPASLRLRRTDVPMQVEALVCDLLAKTPEERPSDARVVRARIAAAQADLALAAARAVLLRSAAPAAGATPAQATISIDKPQPGNNAASRAPTSRCRRRNTVALAGAAVVMAVAATMVPIFWAETGRVAGPATGPIASATTSAATAAVAAPTPAQSLSASPSARTGAAHIATATHTASPTPPPPRTDPITALRQAIAEQVTAGSLNVAAATDLNHMVDDLAHTIATGNTTDVTNKIKALRAKLTTLNKERKLSDPGYRVLNTAVDQVAADQPQPSSPAAPPPPPPPSPHQ